MRTSHKLPDFLDDPEVFITENSEKYTFKCLNRPLTYILIKCTSDKTIGRLHSILFHSNGREWWNFYVFCNNILTQFWALSCCCLEACYIIKKGIQRGSWFRSGARILKRCIEYAWLFLCMVKQERIAKYCTRFNTKTF